MFTIRAERPECQYLKLLHRVVVVRSHTFRVFAYEFQAFGINTIILKTVFEAATLVAGNT